MMPHDDDPTYVGASNLVDKAMSRLHDGDEDRAKAAAAHAARLGWWAAEERPYGVFVARSALFEEIADSLEDADPTEWAWRDACPAVLEGADDLQAQLLRDVLADIVDDSTSRCARLVRCGTRSGMRTWTRPTASTSGAALTRWTP
ncbi:MAG TPA: hypothetical protein VJN29_05195 [Intrasporangium sp.]|uniref:hypothetical protein n=1 Tax=Intrasporangium sp. TaxID=1925024 RepID=UPI002B474D70|nr:hypothetical protein [Intrasporangium sp.]HKX66601.1 hypothetical protein [Intrasporangium sp.]